MIYLIGLLVVCWLGLKLTCFLASIAGEMIHDLTGSVTLGFLAWLLSGLFITLVLLILWFD